VDDQQLLRYSRQIMLPQMDIVGQEKLLSARVLIIGLGGLGSPVAMYLAAAGIGHLVLNDFDTVDLNNLQRQIAHQTGDIGRSKVESARDKLAAINPDIQVSLLTKRLSPESLLQEVNSASLVVDASDNFETRFAVNQACVNTATPLVSGAAIRFEGQLMVYDPEVKDCPCYACLYEDLEDGDLSCAANGVLASLVGVIGSLQATEAIKLLTGIGESLAGYLLVFDARAMDWRKLKLPRKTTCRTCAAK